MNASHTSRFIVHTGWIRNRENGRKEKMRARDEKNPSALESTFRQVEDKSAN